MARKNVLADTWDDGDPEITAQAAPASSPEVSGSSGRSSRGAAGLVGLAIADMASKASVADAIEAKLTAGQTIVELDAAVIDPSFVLDRMNEDTEAFAILRSAIAEQGQSSPILVRPHPMAEGRYQAAFGHRRLRVAKELGRPVKAVVKRLSDEELVLAQGQENSARLDLSYIERARFARRLQDMNYNRDLIMVALGVDKAAVSKMISVTSRIPGEVIEAIGSAPSIGRPRWIELAERLELSAAELSRLTAFIENDAFKAADSDSRFNQVFAMLLQGVEKNTSVAKETRRGGRSDAHFWTSSHGRKLVKITHNTKASAMVFDEKGAPGFCDFVATQMDRLFAAYSKTQSREDSSASVARRKTRSRK